MTCLASQMSAGDSDNSIGHAKAMLQTPKSFVGAERTWLVRAAEVARTSVTSFRSCGLSRPEGDQYLQLLDTARPDACYIKMIGPTGQPVEAMT